MLRSYLFGFTILILSGCDQSVKKQEKSYTAGFKILRVTDTSRIYKPGTDTSDYLHYRPVDIDIWYPAQSSQKDSTLHFIDFLDLLETRSNYYTASTLPDGIINQIAQSFCDVFKCSDSTGLIRLKTSSYKNSPFANGRFPVVLYLSSFNNMGYENYDLFEQLVRKGFIVVSISSIGRYPGDMTMKKEDLMEQVNDALFTLKYLSADPAMDLSRIGILGYSWGGLAGAVVAGKIANAACLISFDGSEYHHYGQVSKEDADFEEIRESNSFREMKLSVPYLRLESTFSEEKFSYDSVYNFADKLSGTKTILGIDSASHQDFCFFPTAVRTAGNCRQNKIYPAITALTISFLEDHLKGENSFQKVLEQDSVQKTILPAKQAAL